MKKYIFYRVTDTYTKTVLENLSVKQVAERLKVSTHYVSSCAVSGILIRGRYKVETEKVYNSIENKTSIPPELWIEWDRICKPLHKAIKKSGKKILITSLDI